MFPSISSGAFRKLALVLDPNKKWKELMQKSIIIQDLYLKEHPDAKNAVKDGGISGARVPSSTPESGDDVVPMEYDQAFYDKFGNPTVVAKIIFDDQKELIPIRLYISQLSPEAGEAIERMPVHMKWALKNKMAGVWGAAHVGIQIGNKLVHFLDHNFVKIDTVKARNALYVSKLSKGGSIKATPQIQKMIAEYVVRWNKEAMYNHAKANCQHFVEFLVELLNTQLPSSEKLHTDIADGNEKLKKFLEMVLKEPGKSGFKFEWDFEKREVEFMNHGELDEFQHKHEQRHELTPVEISFLKGFHRAFQMRENAEKNQEDVEKDCSQGSLTLNEKPATQLFEEDPYISAKYEKEFNKKKVGVDKAFRDRYLNPDGIKAEIFGSIKGSMFNLDLEESLTNYKPIKSDIDPLKQVLVRLYVFVGDEKVEDKFPQSLRYPHVGIQIGDKVLRFLSNHFVDVIPFDEAKPLYIAPISSDGFVTMSDDLKNAVSMGVLEWNLKQYHSDLTNDFRFVQMICAKINNQCKLKSTTQELDGSLKGRKSMLTFIQLVSRQPENVNLDEVFFLKENVPLNSLSQYKEWVSTGKISKVFKNPSPENSDQVLHIKACAFGLLLRELLAGTLATQVSPIEEMVEVWKGLGLSKDFSEIVRKEGIDAAALKGLSKQDLKDLGIPLGDVVKIQQYQATLK